MLAFCCVCEIIVKGVHFDGLTENAVLVTDSASPLAVKFCSFTNCYSTTISGMIHTAAPFTGIALHHFNCTTRAGLCLTADGETTNMTFVTASSSEAKGASMLILRSAYTNTRCVNLTHNTAYQHNTLYTSTVTEFDNKFYVSASSKSTDGLFCWHTGYPTVNTLQYFSMYNNTCGDYAAFLFANNGRMAYSHCVFFSNSVSRMAGTHDSGSLLFSDIVTDSPASKWTGSITKISFTITASYNSPTAYVCAELTQQFTLPSSPLAVLPTVVPLFLFMVQ